jgi:hypothetical protein
MKRPLLITITLLGLLPSTAWSVDTFVLKNGDKVKGDLVRETKDSYIVEVHLAATIREERIIPKDKVVRITKPEAGLAEFELLREMVPTPDGLRAAEYKQRIELATQFIETFPANRHIRKAIEIRDELRDEMRQVEDGAVKIDGVLYPATELRENEYELDARVEVRKIKDLVAGGQRLTALRAYSDFQKDFAHTKAHLDLIPLIQKLIAAHSSQAAEWRSTLDFRVEEREKGLERMTPGGRRDSERAIKEEEENLRRRYRMETATQLGWVTLHPFCKEALDYTIQYAKSELRKIDSLLSNDFNDCGKLYRDLYQMKKQGADERSMNEKIRIMQKSGVPRTYLEKFSAGA